MQNASVKVAVDNPHYRITYEPSDKGLVVVAFAGIGLKLGGLQSEEFRTSLAQHRASDDISVVYVMDVRRRWYNDGVFEPMASDINDLLSRLGAQEVVTLGNSMGGFGAVAFARKLAGCTKAMAFCPQSSVSRAIVPFEDRWKNYRNAIETWNVEDATRELSDGISYDLFFGADEPIDVRHAERFRAAGARGLTVHMIEGCGHNVAQHLKRQQKLGSALHGLIASPSRTGTSGSANEVRAAVD